MAVRGGLRPEKKESSSRGVCLQLWRKLQSFCVILSVFASRLLQKVVLGHIFKNLPLKKAFFAYLHTSMQ